MWSCAGSRQLHVSLPSRSQAPLTSLLPSRLVLSLVFLLHCVNANYTLIGASIQLWAFSLSLLHFNTLLKCWTLKLKYHRIIVSVWVTQLRFCTISHAYKIMCDLFWGQGKVHCGFLVFLNSVTSQMVTRVCLVCFWLSVGRKWSVDNYTGIFCKMNVFVVVLQWC